MYGHDVGLAFWVWEVIGSVGEAHRVAVHGKDLAGHVMVSAHRLEGSRISRCNGAELGAATRERRSHRCNAQVMDHPAFVPTALVVDYKKATDIGEDIDEGAYVIWVRRKPRLGFQHHPYGTDCGQAAVSTGRGQHG